MLRCAHPIVWHGIIRQARPLLLLPLLLLSRLCRRLTRVQRVIRVHVVHILSFKESEFWVSISLLIIN